MSRTTTLFTVAVLATTLAGCAGTAAGARAPGVATPAQTGPATTAPSTASSPTGAPTTDSSPTGAPITASSPTPIQVNPHSKQSSAQLGVQVYWHTTGDATMVTAYASRIMDYVVGLDANTVGLTFPIYTDGLHPTHVYTEPQTTPDPATLGLVIAQAQARGLKVQLRPVIDETNIATAGPNAWRGAVLPSNIPAWFDSYRTVLAPYLDLAEHSGVQEFVIGTELSALLGQTQEWQTTIAAAAARYHGRLSYADDWGSWAAGDGYDLSAARAVDAYPPLPLPDGASQDQLTAGWTAWLRHRSAQELQHTVIQEIGIPATSGAYRHPYLWGGQTQDIQPAIQANWFTAACTSAKNLGMAGMFFWSVDSYFDPAASDAPSGSFIGRGDAAIKDCFASGWPSA